MKESKKAELRIKKFKSTVPAVLLTGQIRPNEAMAQVQNALGLVGKKLRGDQHPSLRISTFTNTGT